MIFIIFLVLIAGLIPCTYFDIKYKEVPVFIMPIALGVCTALNIADFLINHPTEPAFFILNLVLGGAVFGGAMLIFALKNFFGGADVIMIACIGFSLGAVHTIEVVILACVAGVIFAIIKRKKKGFAFAPFLLIGTIADMCITIFT